MKDVDTGARGRLVTSLLITPGFGPTKTIHVKSFKMQGKTFESFLVQYSNRGKRTSLTRHLDVSLEVIA